MMHFGCIEDDSLPLSPPPTLMITKPKHLLQPTRHFNDYETKALVTFSRHLLFMWKNIVAY